MNIHNVVLVRTEFRHYFLRRKPGSPGVVSSKVCLQHFTCCYHQFHSDCYSKNKNSLPLPSYHGTIIFLTPGHTDLLCVWLGQAGEDVNIWSNVSLGIFILEQRWQSLEQNPAQAGYLAEIWYFLFQWKEDWKSFNFLKVSELGVQTTNKPTWNQLKF